MEYSFRVSLMGDRDGQDKRKDSTVPLWASSVFQQEGSTHTHASPVPRNPMTSESLNSESARKEPGLGLGAGFLDLPR